MPDIPKTKFGGAYAAMIRPEPGETTPQAFNVHLPFDETWPGQWRKTKR